MSVSDFSNVISKSDVKSLAEADEQEVVAEVVADASTISSVGCLRKSPATVTADSAVTAMAIIIFLFIISTLLSVP